jgi:hypothetical protein
VTIPWPHTGYCAHWTTRSGVKNHAKTNTRNYCTRLMLRCRCNKGALVSPYQHDPLPRRSLRKYEENMNAYEKNATKYHLLLSYERLCYYYYYLQTNVILCSGGVYEAFQEKSTLHTHTHTQLPPGGYREQTRSWKARGKGDTRGTKT